MLSWEIKFRQPREYRQAFAGRGGRNPILTVTNFTHGVIEVPPASDFNTQTCNCTQAAAEVNEVYFRSIGSSHEQGHKDAHKRFLVEDNNAREAATG